MTDTPMRQRKNIKHNNGIKKNANSNAKYREIIGELVEVNKYISPLRLMNSIGIFQTRS